MANAQEQLQALTGDFQKLQSGMFGQIAPKLKRRPWNWSPPCADLEGLIDGRQKLEAQQQENKGVQDEFATLDEDANIYKLVGPVLLKQDKNEAVMAVNGRLEFIEKEMSVSHFFYCYIYNGFVLT